MDIPLYISFVVVSVGLIVIPGPNVLVIVSSSITHGRVRGLQTVAGTSLAMTIQLIVAGVATSSFVQLLAEGFYILKWLGIAYLIYIAIVHFRAAFFSVRSPTQLTATNTFSRGFFISLSNPKTIVFFSAFLPQFVSPTGSYFQQISVLSGTFLLLAVLFDCCYAILAARLQLLFNQHSWLKIQHGLSGLLILGASAWLAASRRIQ